jgi:hypothetical protein
MNAPILIKERDRLDRCDPVFPTHTNHQLPLHPIQMALTLAHYRRTIPHNNFTPKLLTKP